jgi:hypothetical protein
MYSIMRKLTLCFMFIAPLMFWGCFIEEVQQPSTVQAGGVFTTTLTITDMNAEQNNAHKGVVAILVPEDWSFIDGTYDTPMGVGDMELDTLEPPVWGDVDTVIQRPAGMKWINLLSDQGYLHDANMVYETTINLQVGETTGDFAIGYLVTVNTTDMLLFLNDMDEDQALAGVDTSMNHMVTVTPATGIEEFNLGGIPAEYNLSQNYPNPFNPSTTINFSVLESSNVRLALYDVTGKEINVLVDGFKNAGNYSINFSAGGLSSGIYYYRIYMNGFSQTHKMILMK